MDESHKRREMLNPIATNSTYFENPGLAPGAQFPHQYNTLPIFNYYADPRMNNISPQVLQGHYNTPPRPIDHGIIPNPAYHYPVMNMNSPSPSPGIFNVPRPHFNQGPVGSPMGAASSFYRPQQNPPSSWVGSGGAFNYNTRPNFWRGGNLPNSGFGQGRGRGRSYGNKMSSRPSFKKGVSSYYRKEMVVDPWLGLRPVMWKGFGATDSDNS